MNRSWPGRWLIAVAVGIVFCGLLVAGGLWLSSDAAPAVVSKEAHVPNSKILVVYYSRTGTTARVASSIARATGADLERLQDTVHREGAFGFMRSLVDAIRRSATVLEPLKVNPAAYELVIIGTPDWGKSISAPARTFLTTWRGKLPQVAFFLTDGTSDHAAIFKEMGTLVGKEPLASVGIPHADVDRNQYEDQVATFIQALKLAAPALPTGAVLVPPEALTSASSSSPEASR